jgi:TRAP transporter 4TM/12TM fusion protein
VRKLSKEKTSQDMVEDKSVLEMLEETEQQEEMIESSTPGRDFGGKLGLIFTIVAVVGALYHLWVLNLHPVDPWIFRAAHLLFGCVLGFMLFPGWKKAKEKVHVVDWLLIIASIGVFVYIFVNLQQILFRFGVMPTMMDSIVALVGVLLVLELTRRTSGWTLPILAGIFILYAFIGPYLPSILNHSGYSLDRFVTYIYGLDGVFGVTLDVSSKYILLFIIFGAFLEKSGVGRFFIDFSFALAGGLRGGPAKVAVVSSGLMGMMNGTSAGNAVATGSLTIPLMKRVGYNPKFAAATEATASAGGQIMIPIMGAGAFLMAEITGIRYSEIVIAATIPALLYFLSVFLMVDFEAVKRGMKGIPRKDLPKVKDILKKSYLFIPILVLIGLLLNGYSVIMSGTYSIIACFVVSFFNKETRMGLMKVIGAFELGMKNTIQLLAVCACAGIIVGVLALTGLGLRFSSMLFSVAGSSELLALLFAMLISIILGMGMPTTAAYAVAASVVAPGLMNLGIEPLFAHMFVFYFAVMSAITPPVALAAYAAAGISGTDPMKTGVEAFRLGIAAFIVPFMFIYSPEILMVGGAGSIAFASVTAAIGIYLLAASIQGWFAGRRANIITRVLLVGAALLLIDSGLQTDLIALAVVAVAVAVQLFMVKKDPSAPLSA